MDEVVARDTGLHSDGCEDERRILVIRVFGPETDGIHGKTGFQTQGGRHLLFVEDSSNLVVGDGGLHGPRGVDWCAPPSSSVPAVTSRAHLLDHIALHVFHDVFDLLLGVFVGVNRVLDDLGRSSNPPAAMTYSTWSWRASLTCVASTSGLTPSNPRSRCDWDIVPDDPHEGLKCVLNGRNIDTPGATIPLRG